MPTNIVVAIDDQSNIDAWGLRPYGTWAAGTFPKGAVVTYSGSLWVAGQNTSQTPGVGSDWTILVPSVVGATGAMFPQGAWNATTNVPALASGVGTEGYVYRVSTAGTTTLDTLTDWNVGDLVVYLSDAWRKVRGHILDAVDITDSTAAGRTLLTAADAAAQRAALGLAASATTDTTNASNISSGTLSVNRLPSIPPSLLSNPIFPIQNVESSPVGSAFALQSSLTKTGNRFPIIANNATQELASYSGGPGVIDWFWLCSNNLDDASLLKITLDGRVAYNGVVSQFCAGKYAASQAGFNSDFFIASHGYGGSNNVSWSFYLPMPFSNSFNIELTNKSGANIFGPWHVSYRTGIPNNSPRSKKFTAVPQALSGVAPYTEVTLCDLTGIGPGLFAGLYFLFDSFPGNFLPRYSPLEGYFEFYVDGQTTPVYKTTGGEDFLYEHQNYQEDVPNIPSATSKAISLYVGRYRGITVKTDNTMGLYRLFLPDPKPFEQSIKLVYKAGQQPVTPVGAAPAGVNSTGTLTLFTTCYVYHEN